MQYRKNKDGQPISALGFGCMRFTKNGRSLDIDKAERELMEAIRLGVNYFDTAYIYPGSEALLGEIFERNHVREKINIATKLPQYLVNNRAAIERYFNEELERLRTTWVDYYLMHFLTDISQWQKLKAVGVEQWIEEKKASGQIRHIGFSYHGNTENFLKILNDYDWDFCQIQYNYMDENTQAGKAGLKAAAAKGIPVIIMEPLRGGKLANMLPEKARERIKQDESGYSAVEIALRWLWNQPEVTCVLSGMNSVEMVQENCRIADETAAGSFTQENFALIEDIRKEIRNSVKVSCTGCQYCMPCPKGVDIPGIFRCYNRMYSENFRNGMQDFVQTIALRGTPAFASQCVGCGKCEQHCPQKIEIRKKLKEADKALRPFYMRIGLPVARRFMLRKKK